MKKWIKRIVVALPVVIVLLLVVVGFLFARSVEYFQPVTFKDVYETKKDYYDEHYGLYGKKNPADYGFSDYETVEYVSEKDNIKLHAWHVRAKEKNTDRCILLVHGRGANKLRTMKYLAPFKEGGITDSYSVFIPDFRNSGMSGPGKTIMGPKFADDGYYTLKLLKEKYGYKKFIIYSFSMGAMATAVMVNKEEIKNLGIVIEKIIFDSPVADVKEQLRFSAVEKKGIPAPLFELGFFILDLKNSEDIAGLRLSELMKDINIPVHIFQAENDPTTNYRVFSEQRKLLESNKNFSFTVYPVGDHVKLYQNKANQADYVKTLNSFIKK